MDIRAIYDGSDGEATKALYVSLATHGPIGDVALNLFRAQKASARAKVYRGGLRGKGSYRSMAYDRKNWAMDNLCRVLTLHAATVNLVWGWKEDPAAEFHRWVLYVSIPTGQVSFHAAGRGEGPDYPAEWDGVLGVSADRIVRWCQTIISGDAPVPSEPAPRLPAQRWMWCRHCACFWANRLLCPVHAKPLEQRARPEEVRPGVQAQWNDSTQGTA